MPYGTVNADVIQSSVTGASLGAGNASIMKNRIINGAMVIDQRNAGASVTPTNLQYGVDRWQANLTAASKFSMQQNAGSVTSPAGFTNYLGATSLSSYSVGSSDLFAVMQTIEGYNVADLGWGTADAKTITLSAWVRSSLTGTFGGSITNYSNDRSYPFAYTISSANTWTQISVTIAGDTTGTWLKTNSGGMVIRFGLGAGSTYSGTANAWAAGLYTQPTGTVSVVGTNGATFYITGVQLEVGSSATGFEYRQYQQELALCQRYFTRLIDPPLRGVVPAASNQTGRSACSLPVTMRTAPTSTTSQVGGSGNARFYDGTVSSGAILSVDGFYSKTTSIEYDMTLTVSGYTLGRASVLYIDSANNYSTAFNLSAEL